MKGGASVRVLLDIAFSNNKILAKKASQVLKTQVFLHDEDTNRLKIEYQKEKDNSDAEIISLLF